MRGEFCRSVLVFILSLIMLLPAALAEEKKRSDLVLPLALTVLAGPGLSTSAHLADDLRSALSEWRDFRIFPSIGNGDIANVDDILSRDFVDLAFVQIDTLDYLMNVGVDEGIREKINYIMVAYKAELHLLAKSDIVDLEMLEGKKVNFGPNLEGTYLTATELFANRQIDVTAMTMPHQEAYAMLKSGDIDAMAIVDGKPSKLLEFASLDDGVRLMPVPGTDLTTGYATSTISSQDYPDLLASGDEIETIGVPTVLIAYNWPDDSSRRQALNQFIEALLAQLPALRSHDRGFHPKWRESDIWRRLPDPWQRDPNVLRLLNPMKRFEDSSQ